MYTFFWKIYTFSVKFALFCKFLNGYFLVSFCYHVNLKCKFYRSKRKFYSKKCKIYTVQGFTKTSEVAAGFKNIFRKKKKEIIWIRNQCFDYHNF